MVLAAGPRVFDSQGDPVSSPKLAPMSAVGMTAENTAVPESDPVFSEVTPLPSTLKSFERGCRIAAGRQRVAGQRRLVMHPDMVTRLRKIREGSGTGTYMLMNGDAGIAGGAPTGPGTTFRLLGVPVRSPPRCPAPGLAASSSWPT